MKSRALTYIGITLTILITVLICAEPSFAGFEAPFKKKADEIEKGLLVLGSVVVGIGFLCALIQASYTRPNYAWAVRLIVVGIALTSFATLKTFITG